LLLGIRLRTVEERGSGIEDVILDVRRAERATFKEMLFVDGGVAAFWTVVDLLGGELIGYLVNQLPGL
jgi:hypothetical protein